MTEFPLVEYVTSWIFVVWLSIKLYRKLRWPLIAAGQWAAAMAFWQLYIHADNTGPAELMYKNLLSSQALFTLFGGALFLYFINTDYIKLIGRIIHVLAVASIPITYLAIHTDSYWLTAGLMLNPAMNLSLAICTIPFFRGSNHIFWYFAIWLPISWHSSTSFATWLAVLSAVMLIENPILALGTIALGAITGFFVVDGWAGLDTERWQWYSFFWQHFISKPVNLFSGLGVNHFTAIGPKLQVANTNPNEIWSFLHSDWFQILFEQGVLGFSLWLSVAIIAMWRAYHRHQELFAVGAGFSVMMLTYFPLHTSAGMLLALLLLTPMVKRPLEIILAELRSKDGRLY